MKRESLYTKNENRLVYQFDGETMWIEGWGKNSLRVRATKLGTMDKEDCALQPNKNSIRNSVSIDINSDGTACIRNGNIKGFCSLVGKITFKNQDDKVILEEYLKTDRGDWSLDSNSCLNIDAREFKSIIAGDFKLTQRFFSTSADEHIFGMGQYQTSCINLKGMDLELAHRNSQASVPFYISSEGYGFLWNNPAIGRVVFSKNITSWQAESTKKLDYWITVGDNPKMIEEQYADITGKVPMMPDYAMGFWQCKLRYQTQEELLEVARTYKQKGYPISVIVVDFFHWPQQGDWKFDKKYWPDPDAMVKELKNMGIELMVSIWPSVDYKSENFEEMRAKGYLVQMEKGIKISMDCRGNTIFFDATNPEAQKYIWSKCKKNYYDKGVKIFWLDESEPEYTVYDYDNYRYYAGSNLQVGNIYPLMYAKAFFNGMKEEGQENIINLVRCAWAGSQKYGALIWSGDIHSDFSTLRKQIAAGLNMGVAGIPWLTTDIGGFYGGRNDDPDFKELLVRWFEYGTFCPVMRLHGQRLPRKIPIGTCGGGACASYSGNEVWTYGKEFEAIFTKYLFMREKLKPYISLLMKEAHEKGTPIMRMLSFEFPEDEKAWEDQFSYMFGSDLLVSPVVNLGDRKKLVYLPKGHSWINAWTEEIMDGGNEVSIDAPLDKIPLFYKDTNDLNIVV